MKYKSGYKYQLAGEEEFQTSFRPEETIVTRFIKLDLYGKLTIFNGYAWDGTSGPVIDRKTNMRASACHDGLYQLMRMRFLDHHEWRQADKEFAKTLKEDGAWRATIKIDMLGLKIAGGKSAHPDNRREIKEAP